MAEMFAKDGERVMNHETGETICRVKGGLYRLSPLKSGDFQDFADGEEPWKPLHQLDRRCIREKPSGGFQIFVEGEWRPV